MGLRSVRKFFGRKEQKNKTTLKTAWLWAFRHLQEENKENRSHNTHGLKIRNITTHSLGLMKNVMQRLYVMKKIPLPFRLPFKMTYGNPHKPFNHTVLQYYIILLLYLYIEIINK